MDIASLGAGEAWKELMDAFLDTTAHGFRAPKSGSADVELARTVLTEGLDSLNAIRTAVAELGGGDFAEEQRDLRRMLRKALVPSAGKPPDPRKVEEAQAAIRKAARSVGKALAVLAEAHSRSVEVGARQLLLTLEVMVVRELGLKSSQEAQFKELVARMKTRLPDLVGQLFDKAFQDLIRSRMKE
jgi:hypothetical protein